MKPRLKKVLKFKEIFSKTTNTEDKSDFFLCMLRKCMGNWRYSSTHSSAWLNTEASSLECFAPGKNAPQFLLKGRLGRPKIQP